MGDSNNAGTALSLRLGGKWEPVRPQQGTDTVDAAALLEAAATEVYRSPNLMVLMGLGTSLGLMARDGRTAPTMWKLFELIKGLPGFSDAAAIAPGPVDAEDVEALLSACQMHNELAGTEAVGTFLAAAERKILEACSFVDDSTDLSVHEMFLRKVGRRSTRISRTRIFTTNYDLAVESAAQRSGFTLLDGFGPVAGGDFDGGNFDLDIVRRTGPGQMQLATNVVHLLKLHGSVDWDDSTGAVRRVAAPASPVLIYPSNRKYQQSYRPPYLESMARYQMALRLPETTVIVVGFGLNDAHLTAPLMSAVRSNVSLRLIVVDPKLAVDPTDQMVNLIRLVDSGDGRIALVAGTFGDFAAALPDASPFDAHELHSERMKVLQ